MTHNDDQDPGWWHRGMTQRAQIIIIVLSGLILVGAIIYALTSGIRIF